MHTKTDIVIMICFVETILIIENDDRIIIATFTTVFEYSIPHVNSSYTFLSSL
jgi:hypothetical protein